MPRPLDHLPEIGERILVRTGASWAEATIISMYECRVRSPELWTAPRNRRLAPAENTESRGYAPEDTIRAFCFHPADGLSMASFCIMRFGQPGNHTYNPNIVLPG